MRSATQVIRKLRRPPAVQDWVKNIRERRDDTARALFNFAINPPRTSLASAIAICANIVFDQISLAQAISCTKAIKDPTARERAQWIVRAFHPFAMDHQLTGVQVFRDLEEFYRVSSEVKVPVRPTFVVRSNGQLVPYFLICWSQIGLTVYQKRILSTLIEHAILSLEEFQGSDAVIICTPIAPHCKKERHVISWNVSSFPALDADERQKLFDRHDGALSDAEKMIVEIFG